MMNLLLPLLTAVALANEGAEGAAEAAHHAEGIPWGPIGFHAMNLAILLAIIVRYARKPVKDAVVNRAAAIRKGIEDSANMHRDAEHRLRDLDKRMDGFDAQLSGMKAEAEVESTREREETLSRARKDAAFIAQGAERTIQTELACARTELRAEAVKLAVNIAEQQIHHQLRVDDESRYAAEFMRSVKEAPNG